MNALAHTQARIAPDQIPGFVQTRGGKLFNLLAPDSRTIDFDHIATTLASQPLYAGRTEKFYSVAQHCTEVAKTVRHEYRLTALLSKAACAYMGDISPIRDFFPDIAATEDKVQRAVYRHFGIEEELLPEVARAIREADLAVQAAEFRDLQAGCGFSWLEAAGIKPIPRTIIPANAERARRMFVSTYHCTRCTDLLGDVQEFRRHQP